jgi:hypothetical protein
VVNVNVSGKPTVSIFRAELTSWEVEVLCAVRGRKAEEEGQSETRNKWMGY